MDRKTQNRILVACMSEFRGAGYLCNYYDKGQYKYMIETAVARLSQFADKFDAICVSGNSGCLSGIPVAFLMNKDIIIIRKPDVNSHTTGTIFEGKTNQRYIILDDQISSGATVRRMIEGAALGNCTCVGMYMMYLTREDTDIPIGSGRTIRNVMVQEPGPCTEPKPKPAPPKPEMKVAVDFETTPMSPGPISDFKINVQESRENFDSAYDRYQRQMDAANAIQEGEAKKANSEKETEKIRKDWFATDQKAEGRPFFGKSSMENLSDAFRAADSEIERRSRQAYLSSFGKRMAGSTEILRPYAAGVSLRDLFDREPSGPTEQDKPYDADPVSMQPVPKNRKRKAQVAV
jgi:hypothetical protein